MKRAVPWLGALVITALVIVVLAPVVLAGAMPPTVTLKGPSDANLNARVTLSGTLVNTNGGKGAKYVVIQQKLNTSWKIIAKTQPHWLNGPNGKYAVKITVKNPAMSLSRYRAVWKCGGVKGYSRTLIIAVQ